MIELREYLWKEKAEMIKDKDTLQYIVKELEQRLKQVCTYIDPYTSYSLIRGLLNDTLVHMI